MSLTPRFQLHLAGKVLAGRAVLGRFDGSTASVAYATAAGKVFVHSPQDHSSGAAGQQQCLNINKQVTALAAGALLPNSVRDVLLIGTPTCLHCYDAERNCDLFFRDAPEGVQALAVGAHGPQRTPVVYVGGAGTLQAWDASGRELFWTAVGGAVTALALADVDGDGCLELLAGCDDGSICMFRDSQQLQHITEADGVVALAGLGPGRKWAYALANGTIGVYAAGVRLWRVKSNHVANSLVAYELGAGSTAAEAGTAATGSSAAGAGKVRCSTSGDGAAGALQLVSGWSNGRVEARCASSGEVVGRDSLGASIAVLLVGQLRDAGGAELELLAVSTEGELRGYLPHHDELVADVGGDVSLQQRLLVELAQKKQQLVYELASYQQATGGGSMTSGAAADGSGSGSSGGGGVAGSLTALAGGLLGSRGGTASSGGGASSHPSGTGGGAVTAGHIASIIPPDTCVDSAITVNKTTQTCELLMKTNNDTVIRAALIFGEQVFEHESLLVAPQQPSSSLTVPLAPRRDTPVLLMTKVLVGSRTGAVYHVFELDVEMPKYALYAAEELPPPGGVPESYVCVELQVPASRVSAWLEARFGSRAQLATSSVAGSTSCSLSRSRSGKGAAGSSPASGQQLVAHFTCLRTKQPLAVRAAPSASGSLMVWLHCDCMLLAGELLQDLAGSLGITELSSTASFPHAMAAFKHTLATVEAASAARSVVDSQAAMLAMAIKDSVLRAEDARLLRDVSGLRRAHARLADLNRDMWLEHERRVANQAQLLQGLRAVNVMIQAAAGLRVGPAQGRVVAACRAAIKANNLAALDKVVCSGA